MGDRVLTAVGEQSQDDRWSGRPARRRRILRAGTGELADARECAGELQRSLRALRSTTTDDVRHHLQLRLSRMGTGDAIDRSFAVPTSRCTRPRSPGATASSRRTPSCSRRPRRVARRRPADGRPTDLGRATSSARSCPSAWRDRRPLWRSARRIDPTAGRRGRAPSRSLACTNSLLETVLRIASSSAATVAAGVPVGTAMPRQASSVTSKPCSRAVGTSGKAGSRVATIAARKRTCPLLRYCASAAGSCTTASTWPPSRLGTTCAAANGTSTAWTPAG